MMKKILVVVLFSIMVFSLAAYENTSSGAQGASESTKTEDSAGVTVQSAATIEKSKGSSKVLVAFFSRADENYGVGYVEKGNTAIIAGMISEKMNADTFEIKRTTPYPAVYDECTDEAKQEQKENARPELAENVENFNEYDVIFLGYPNWWGDMPMPVYTFLESYDFSDKTIIPFCTHAGSGLSRTESSIRKICPKAVVLNGFEITGTAAQNKQDEAGERVLKWIESIGI